MKFPRRQFLHLAAGAGALLVASRVVSAEDYPTRPVRFVVGFPGGSATDIVGRLIAQSLSERLGQQVIVDNRPGAAPTATRSFRSLRRTQSMRRSTTSSASISSMISRRSRALSGTPTSWWSAHHSRPKPFPSSSPMPKPTQAKSTWHRPATAACQMLPENYSR